MNHNKEQIEKTLWWQLYSQIFIFCSNQREHILCLTILLYVFVVHKEHIHIGGWYILILCLYFFTSISLSPFLEHPCIPLPPAEGLLPCFLSSIFHFSFSITYTLSFSYKTKHKILISLALWPQNASILLWRTQMHLSLDQSNILLCINTMLPLPTKLLWDK